MANAQVAHVVLQLKMDGTVERITTPYMTPTAFDDKDTADPFGSIADVDIVHTSNHCPDRMEERDVTKEDMQRCVKYGQRTVQPHDQRVKFTFEKVVYITDQTETYAVTVWREGYRAGRTRGVPGRDG